MTTNPIVALLLSAALVTAPSASRHHLPARTGILVGNRWAGAVIGLTGIAVLLVLAHWTVAVVAGMVGIGLVRWWQRRRLAQRRGAEGQTVAAALETLIGELGVGAHPVRAFAIAAAETGGQVGASLRGVAARACLGADVVAGLRAEQAVSAVPAYWARLAVFWELAVQHGLPMSVLMQAAHRDIVERQRFAAGIYAALAGARATSVILALLPILGVALGQLIGAHPLGFLFGGGVGGALLVVGAGLVGVGLAWSQRIIDRLVQ